MVASVFLSFLLLSCGIPTYFDPDAEFAITNRTAVDNGATFTMSFTTDSTTDTDADEDSCGLLLLYYYGDSSLNSQDQDKIISAFASSYKTPQEIVDPSSIDDPVITCKSADGESTFEVYAFTNAGSVISAPDYNLDLDITEDYDVDVTLAYADSVVTYTDDYTTFELGFDSETKLEKDKYIYVFAAVSAQGQNFSNLYWTKLKYAGYILIQ